MQKKKKKHESIMNLSLPTEERKPVQLNTNTLSAVNTSLYHFGLQKIKVKMSRRCLGNECVCGMEECTGGEVLVTICLTTRADG